MFEYRATVVEVYDGDTITVDIDLGFHISLRDRVRLLGVDTPEIRGPDKQWGLEVRDFLRGLILGKQVVLRTHKADEKGKYGRWLGTLFLDGENINQLLIDRGMANVYPSLQIIPLHKETEMNIITIIRLIIANAALIKELIELIMEIVDAIGTEDEAAEMTFEKLELSEPATTYPGLFAAIIDVDIEGEAVADTGRWSVFVQMLIDNLPAIIESIEKLRKLFK